jgi:hypothetical protein
MNCESIAASDEQKYIDILIEIKTNFLNVFI